MPKKVVILDNHPNLRFSKSDTAKILKFVYSKEKKILPSIAVVYTYDNYIKRINRYFLNHNYSTDVLAFDFKGDSDLSAEIYINLDAAKRQAEEFNENFKDEVTRLIIHACLHLIGHKDKMKSDQSKMFRYQEKYLRLFKRQYRRETRKMV